MKLSQLFSLFPQLKWGESAQKEVASVCFDSRAAGDGAVFVAVRGTGSDGHQYLEAAARAGAIALVVEDDAAVPGNYNGAVAVVPDTRLALGELAARFYGDPSSRLFCVGVTGTNGKTTTTHMIEAIFQEFEWKTGVVGTIDHHLGTQVWKTELTTPDPVSFQKRLGEFAALGAHAAAMEVSSHALMQSRVDAVAFDVAVFSNLSRDHLDYHKDMEDYFLAKSRLFTHLLVNSAKKNRLAIINEDDDYGARLIASLESTGAVGATNATGLDNSAGPSNPAGSSNPAGQAFTTGSTKANGPLQVWTYGQAPNADFRFMARSCDFSGTAFHLSTPRGEHDFHLRMPGIHNVYNAVSSIAVAVAAGASLAICARALASFTGVAGRLEPVDNRKGVHVFVDFAHTDGALAAVLENLNAIRKAGGLRNRIFTVFGCGGDRDRGKRPLMMKAALAGSDVVLLTSDNPRTENPQAILNEALAGAPQSEINHRVFTEIDRRQGIHRALREAAPGDVVLIAGKGHVSYQQIGTQKFDFSDVAVAREYFDGLADDAR